MLTNDSETITLQHTWVLGPALTSGGFGRIYEAKDENGQPAVIKLVPKAPGASRELLFESLSGHPNIIPILDSGEWGNYYVLVMPRAEKSLRQHLHEAGEKLPMNESLSILIDVAEALAGLERDVVHRDLKPENILFYQGHWCLADFGIARYAEATTAPDTRKHSFTPQYAAPEQWRTEHSMPATDIYAFGIIAFELFQGYRPFSGSDSANYREQHLKQPPPSLSGISPAIAALVTECLYKMPQARPPAANILQRLRKSQQPSSPAAARLQVVNQEVIEKQSQAGAIASAQKSIEEQRRNLFATAQQSFEMIVESLIEQILNAAPASTVSRPMRLIELGKGTLVLEKVKSAAPNCLAVNNLSPFDVIAYTSISTKKPRDRFGYEGRSHSLWFCDAYDEGMYRWYETAFMEGLFGPRIASVKPFALSPEDRKSALAFTQTLADCSIAWEPLPFDQGDEDQFIERWLGWFAASANGSLSSPLSMPENSGGHHRHSR